MIGRAVRRKNVFTLSPLSHKPIRTGMSYGMRYGGRVQEAPAVAPPIPRQSLAQMVLVHRYQVSKYIPLFARPMGLMMQAGYPVDHVLKLIPGAPVQRNTPVLSNAPMSLPRTAKGGTMRPMSRWAKALPLTPNPYNPPTYGGKN